MPSYHRPPLSKAWLTKDIDERQLTIRDISALERKGITLKTDSAIEAIDPHARSARVSDGSLIHWSGLVLATGATPRRLPGSEASQIVHVLRSRKDATEIARRLQDCVQESRPVVVIGGGFIGLEVAASARKLGLDVTIVEAAPRLLERVLSSDLSEWYADLHISRGTKLLIGAQVSSIEPVGPDQAMVHLADGRSLHAGLVVAGVGVTPNDELARKAGIACDNGIIVDDCCRTSLPNIVAAGDCTVRRLPDGSKVRLESVQNAVEQGRSAALALLGKDRPFVETPWFWSDQYDIKLQIAGLSRGADTPGSPRRAEGNRLFDLSLQAGSTGRGGLGQCRERPHDRASPDRHEFRAHHRAGSGRAVRSRLAAIEIGVAFKRSPPSSLPSIKSKRAAISCRPSIKSQSITC